MSQSLIFERPDDHLALIRINLPKVHNALNLAMLDQLQVHLAQLSRDDIRVLVITGTGKSFSSGADLKALQKYAPDEAHEFALEGHWFFQQLEDFPAPVLAAINGYALGGGCELACACDLRYAAASAKLGLTETTVGMVPGWGGTFRLPRYIGLSRTRELVYTGRLLEAEEARQIGLVNGVFPDETFMHDTLAVARRIAANAPIGVRLAKRLLNRRGHELKRMIGEDAAALAETVASEDQTEAIAAFLEKRKPKFHNR